MENRTNYQKQLDSLLLELSAAHKVPSLLLHACCAPCSSYVLSYLAAHFHITVFFYNPNIYPPSEYQKRVEEQRRFLSVLPAVHPISFLEGDFREEDFYQAVKGLESIPEGGERCFACYELRLRQTAALARERNFQTFTTTLSISPLKNAEKLNEIGGRLALEYGVPYLFSDFKKKDGYRQSVALSAQYGLYRQDYCGCIFSKREAEARHSAQRGENDA